MLDFDHTHYVPILRWKRAEQFALRDLYDAERSQITPLVELVPEAFDSQNPPGSVSVDKKLGKTADNIFQYWGQDPLFVDLWLLPPKLRTVAGNHPFIVLGQMARSRQLSLIPVTGLQRDQSYQSAVSSLVQADRHGVCIRLLREDIRRSEFINDLKRLLTYLELHPEEVDLLVDYQIIDDSGPAFAKLCTRIPVLSHWRTFSVTGGAFPKDLSELEKNRQHKLERRDWMAWQDQVTGRPILPRRPTYGDYSIQHPIYSKHPGFMNFSGSIRYTYDEYWVIMRGEGVFNADGPGFNQFPANAQLLCDRSEFYGASFSEGDRYIREMGSQVNKTGNAATWLQAGINHHLTLTVRQIASLFGT